jgi:endonuclease III
MAGKISVRRTRRLRVLWAKHYKVPTPPDPQEAMLEQIVMTVLWLDAPPARARLAYVNLAEEFVDWNELRVSVASEVGRILETCGLPASKGAVLKRILSRAVEVLFSFDFQQLAELPRQRLKAWFVGIPGVPHRVAAGILYYVYGYDRVLVDSEIARVIRRLGLAGEEATEEEIEAGMVGVMPARDAHFIYSSLWQHATRACTKKDFDCKSCPLRKECETGKRRIAEMAAAARAARRKARKEAKAKAAAAKRKKASKAKTKRQPAAKAKPKARKPAPSAKAASRKAAKAKPSRRTSSRTSKKPSKR